jgi:hypothetical protein
MPDKPNVLVIWDDDIGITNLSRAGLGQSGPWQSRTTTR